MAGGRDDEGSRIVRVEVLLDEGACPPEYKTPGSAGADLRARLGAGGTLSLKPGERALVPTGIRIELPHGYEAQVRSRSGLAIDRGVVCLNSPGTIDSDYRGEIKVILANLGSAAAEIADGDRIAQMVIAPVARAEFRRAESLGRSARDEGGFGSTGR